MSSRFRILSILRVSLMAVGVTFTGVATAGSGPEQRNVDSKTQVPAGDPGMAALEDLATAHRVALWSHAKKSPHGMVLAAEMMISLRITDGVQREKSEQQAGAKPEDKPSVEVPTTPEALLEEASKLAGRDEVLKTRIAALRKQLEGSRGDVRGPGRNCTRALANSTDHYRVVFRGGEYARVAVSGDGDSDLDLLVFDENDNLVVQDTSYGDDPVVSWTPSWTGPFKIRVRNLGNVWNRYCIFVN